MESESFDQVFVDDPAFGQSEQQQRGTSSRGVATLAKRGPRLAVDGCRLQLRRRGIECTLERTKSLTGRVEPGFHHLSQGHHRSGMSNPDVTGNRGVGCRVVAIQESTRVGLSARDPSDSLVDRRPTLGARRGRADFRQGDGPCRSEHDRARHDPDQPSPDPRHTATLGNEPDDYGARAMTRAVDEYRVKRLMTRLVGIGIIAIIGVVPVVLDRDSYPLSTYPMFSSRRTATEPVHTAVVATAKGTFRRLSPTQISGNDEIIIAARLVYEAIRRDGGEVLCADIASRLPATFAGDDVEIVSETYDAIDWYEGRRSPISRVVHTSCRVPGDGS